MQKFIFNALWKLRETSKLISCVCSDEERDVAAEGNFKPKLGDRVQVNLDCDIFEAMQQNHGDWHPLLANVRI